MDKNSMINKQYTVKLGNELHISRLTSSDSSKNAIALKIENQKERLLSTINKDRIVDNATQVSARSITSNTSKIVATDIVVDGIPYLYKWPKVSMFGYTTRYSSRVYEPAGEFVYATTKNILAVMQDSNGIDRYSIELEFVPVFIDSRYTNLQHIIDMDGKYFTPKRKKDHILSTFSKDIKYFNTQNNIFESNVIDKSDITSIEIDEFIYEIPTKLENKNAIIKYEYFPYQHTIIRSFRENKTIGPTGLIALSNKNLDLSNVFIKKINNVSVNIDISEIASPASGVICVAQHMQSNTLKDGDVVEIEYNYLFINKPFVSINTRKLNGDSRVHTYIGPTEISGRNIVYKYDKNFGAIIAQNDFIIGDVFNFTSINIAQTGNQYIYDYKNQNQIQFVDSGIMEQFYTSNINNVDVYLNTKKFKSCGVFKVNDTVPVFVDAGLQSSIKDNFYDHEFYNTIPGSVVVLGGDSTILAAGIGKIQNESILPIRFNIDHEIPGYVYIEIDVKDAEYMDMHVADQEVLDFCTQADEINQDFSYNKNKFSVCYIVGASEIICNASFFFNNITKEFYAKIDKIPGAELRLKFNNMKSSYGVTI